MTVRRDGVDISHYQGSAIDYAAGKRAGVKFVCHKATEGTAWVDDRHDQRRREVTDAGGLLWGAYHFARPYPGQATAQARHFLTVAEPAPGDMWPMLDLETNDGQLGPAALTDWVADWLAVIRQELGCGAYIYTHFTLRLQGGIADCPLWRARYSDSMTLPTVPQPWSRWDVWQFSNGQYPHDDPITPGFGRVDCNTLNTDDPDALLARYIIGGTDDMPSVDDIMDRQLTPEGKTVADALRASLAGEGRSEVLAQLLRQLADDQDALAGRVADTADIEVVRREVRDQARKTRAKVKAHNAQPPEPLPS